MTQELPQKKVEELPQQEVEELPQQEETPEEVLTEINQHEDLIVLTNEETQET